MEKRMMRSGEVAKALGLSSATIQAYARNGRIPARTTPGGQYRFDLDEVRAVLNPPMLETRSDLVDLFSGDAAVSDLSPFRPGDVDAVTMRRMRVRAFRPNGTTVSAEVEPASAGASELASVIKASSVAAMVVLRREPVDA